MKKSEIAKIIADAEKYCAHNNVRFTPPRRMVLEIIAAGDKPLGAYDVLDRLALVMDHPRPPTAYRAIEFLQEHGFIHRIESLNAYVVCHTDHKHDGSQFMICDRCGTVIETHLCQMPKALADKANDAGFHLHHWNTEIHGTCRDCS
jgi:Fur family zinc uptake transcriptional regulator